MHTTRNAARWGCSSGPGAGALVPASVFCGTDLQLVLERGAMSDRRAGPTAATTVGWGLDAMTLSQPRRCTSVSYACSSRSTRANCGLDTSCRSVTVAEQRQYLEDSAASATPSCSYSTNT